MLACCRGEQRRVRVLERHRRHVDRRERGHGRGGREEDDDEQRHRRRQAAHVRTYALLAGRPAAHARLGCRSPRRQATMLTAGIVIRPEPGAGDRDGESLIIIARCLILRW